MVWSRDEGQTANFGWIDKSQYMLLVKKKRNSLLNIDQFSQSTFVIEHSGFFLTKKL